MQYRSRTATNQAGFRHTEIDTMRKEIRSFTAAQPFTVRTLADGTKQVGGYAVVWNSRSVDLGGFTEICAPTMLDRTLRESPDVLILRDHKQELLLGRTTANTLQLRTDSTGLAFTVALPQTAIGGDTAENVRLRNLTGCSFGFSVAQDGDSWAVDSDGNVVRTLLDVDLFEISITSFPAYQATSVDARSKAAEMRSQVATRTLDDDCDPDTDDDCDDDDESDDEAEDRCSCRCERCAMRDCSHCYSRDCCDENCSACPQQDGRRMDGLRIRQLFNSRRANLLN
jgi:uncharacterized protein